MKDDNAQSQRAMLDGVIHGLKACTGSTPGHTIEGLLDQATSHTLALVEAEGELPGKARDRLALFNDRASGKQRTIIAGVLLRLIGAEQRTFEDREFAVKAFDLLDDVLASSLYRELKISPRDQRYEKERVLRDVAPSLEQQLKELADNAVDLSDLRSYRQRAFKALRSAPSKAVVHPLVPSELFGSALDRVFSSVVAYADSDPSTIYERREDVLEAYSHYHTKAAAVGGYYTEEVLIPLVTNLRDAVTADFERNPVANPAELLLAAAEKKYPLSEIGREIDFRLNVINEGQGPAIDVELTIVDTEGMEVLRTEQYLGWLEGRQRQVVVPGVVKPGAATVIAAEVSWRNADGTTRNADAILSFQAQTTDVDWEALEYENPYDLEPVHMPDELVGRGSALRKLMGLARAKSLGNAIVTGQKRVGKTSIVRTLESELLTETAEPFVVYIEAGEVITTTPQGTLAELGRTIAERIRSSDECLSELPIPDFEESIAPLGPFLDRARQVLPTLRALAIIDEFDEIPIDLYRRGPLGDALFLALRSISSRPYVGFILVGGEKMDFVLSAQGQALNKFTNLRVDYFDAEKQWDEVSELVRRPSRDVLEFTDEAVYGIYEYTAGHPFFTKLICAAVFSQAVERRDSHITRDEVEEAVVAALSEAGPQSFQHFWDDAILENEDSREFTSIRRRRVLIGLGRALRPGAPATADEVSSEGKGVGLASDEVEGELRGFARRGILASVEERYRPRLRFFERWLCEEGVYALLTTFTDPEGVARHKEAVAAIRVSAQEIRELVSGWGLYRGRRIGVDDVRAWLDQFEAGVDQRLMFQLLRGVEFYQQDRVRLKLREAFGIARRNTRIDVNSRKRHEFLVSFFGGEGKSGAKLARLFADENQIYVDNIVRADRVPSRLREDPKVQVVVYVDDFIGTGHQARGYVDTVLGGQVETWKEESARGLIVAVTGFLESLKPIENALGRAGLTFTTHLCDPMGQSSRCFSPETDIFDDDADRQTAAIIARDYGSRLVKDAPMGYGGSESLVVFEDTCPNNTLPILWARGQDWEPLFPRH